jgi:hypothetical protein
MVAACGVAYTMSCNGGSKALEPAWHKDEMRVAAKAIY